MHAILKSKGLLVLCKYDISSLIFSQKNIKEVDREVRYIV